MQFEILKKSYLKRNIIIGIIVIAIISTVILTFTRAKYQVTESIPLVNGTINYSPSDLNAVAIYVNSNSGYIKSDTIPESGYVLNEGESYCTVNGEKDSSINLTYDSNTKTLSVIPFTTKGTKCYLYFNQTLKNAILTDNTLQTTIPDFSKTAQADCTGIENCEETNGLYQAKEDDGTTYYFRGAVDSNWVSFANYYWRIIRINRDESIRLIYSGDSESGPAETGEDTQIGTSAFNEEYNDNAYVGYMYGTPGSDTYEETHANINDSTIKTALDNWYTSNLSSYASNIDGNAGFCGDRTPSTEETNNNGLGGMGTTITYYGARYRLYIKSLPSLECNTNDLYTTHNSNIGNNSLVFPIGLITADELVYSGNVWQQKSSNYLNTGLQYWTMTPFSKGANDSYVYSYGNSEQQYGLNNDSVNDIWGIRPVINLDKNVTISSGDGTSSNPYIIAT